ncbi:RteC domain-containing protein [Pedobacter foliorum]|uniref:RteC domain-containing protein n=1 Tax=Pedobacter foliorum TaxID=2739058 RepID=UPI001565B5C3|nr:RteC domain-containing protein [Pedobacter foliorum]NRF41129.1 RteC domain-containing protein [Pedobacter foliorum]
MNCLDGFSSGGDFLLIFVKLILPMMKNENTNPTPAWILFEKKSELAFLNLQQRLTDMKVGVPLETLNAALVLIQSDLQVLDNSFAELADLSDSFRIVFFKQIRPKFVALWLFYLERYHLILGKPLGTKEAIRSFYELELRQLDFFLKRYGFYYSYFRSGMSQADHLYFLPDLKTVSLTPELPVSTGMSRTVCDYLYARFIACELITKYVLAQLNDLDKPDTPLALVNLPKKKKIQTQFNLSVDQLGMVARAALDASLVKGKSFQSLCEELAPLVVTSSGQTSVSAGSLRSNAYTGEDIDKHILIRSLEKMIRLIKEY